MIVETDDGSTVTMRGMRAETKAERASSKRAMPPHFKFQYTMNQDEKALLFKIGSDPKEVRYEGNYGSLLTRFATLGLITVRTANMDKERAIYVSQKKKELVVARRNVRDLALHAPIEQLQTAMSKVADLEYRVKDPKSYGPRDVIYYKRTERAREIFAAGEIVINYKDNQE